MNTRREIAKKEGLWKDCGEPYIDGVCNGEYEHPKEEDTVDDGNGVIYQRNKDTGQLERMQIVKEKVCKKKEHLYTNKNETVYIEPVN